MPGITSSSALMINEFPFPALELNPPGYTDDQDPLLSNISIAGDAEVI